MDWFYNFIPTRETLESRMFLIPLFPLIGFLINGLYGRKFSPKFAGFIGTMGAFCAFVWAALCVRHIHKLDNAPHALYQYSTLHAIYGTWISTPALHCSFGLFIDQLSAVMIMIVTGIGTLIHIYSMGYMAHDPGIARFFAYLNLFLFSMILLVLGDNLLLLFVGWEGVGLCSYLLIGFWYEDGKNAAAGMKAFIVNRIGDLGFLVGMFVLIAVFGTVNFVAAPVHENGTIVTPSVQLETRNDHPYAALPIKPGLLDYTGALNQLIGAPPDYFVGSGGPLSVGVAVKPEFSNFDLSKKLGATTFPASAGWTLMGVLTLACLCLFVGACGKSAQIPLYVWLPDAMAGPTPVSALIHAATMVTAGIYMVCRLHPLFSLSPTALLVIGGVGAATALFSALIGLTQLDIKKVLAYSTVSQLGYMFLGLGMGAFSLGIFHVVTHAFFKALLFLGAGSVIHAMSGEQDMRKMGGLKGKLPWTFTTMLCGSLALAGVPFTAGWYSKDSILATTLARFVESHNSLYLVYYILGIVGAFCTAFYTFRLMFLTFFGENRASDDVQHHIHESPWTMVLPLVILAVLSLFGGMLFNHLFVHMQAGLRNVYLGEEAEVMADHLNLGITQIITVLGIGLAWFRYGRGQNVPNPETALKNPLYRASFNKFYVDEIYDATIVFPFRIGSELLHWLVDVLFIDGLITGFGYLVAYLAGVFRRIQTGVVNTYAFAVLSGGLLVLMYFYTHWK